MSRPSLSVIMPNYNHGRYLREALAAITAQSRPPKEILVVDDASTDDSLAILEELRRANPLIRVLRNEKNLGAIATINRGLENATGDYVVGASADDKVLPGFFEKSLDLLARDPSAGLCSSRAYQTDENLKIVGDVYCPPISRTPCFLPPAEVLRKLRAYGPWFLGNTTVYRREALIAAGGFMPELSSYCDGFISMAVALKHGACFTPERLACWRRMPSGLSARSGADAAVSLGIMERARALMRGRYRDLFPDDFIRDWEKDWLFNVRYDALTARGNEIARLKNEASASDRLKFDLLLAGNAAQRFLARAFRVSPLKRLSSGLFS